MYMHEYVHCCMQVWHMQDTVFKQPRAEVFVKVVCSGANTSAKHAVMIDLAARLINEHLTEYAYAASVAELQQR